MVYSKTNILLIYQQGFIQDLKLDGGGGGGGEGGGGGQLTKHGSLVEYEACPPRKFFGEVDSEAII